MSQRYAIGSLEEAEAYLQHPVLGPRLIDCTGLALRVDGVLAHDIFGSPDDLKFHSCMTLFARVPDAPACFGEALARFFGGKPDGATLALLGTKQQSPGLNPSARN